MNRQLASIITACASMLCTQAASGQSFSSGSNGSDGAFTATNTPVPFRLGGVYHYTTFTVPPGVNLTYQRGPDNAPIVILATLNVQIDGTINVGGALAAAPPGEAPAPGSPGGSGGFNGGSGGTTVITTLFQATPGLGPGGGAPGSGSQVGGFPGVYGAPTLFESLVPLFGGSGGGGGFHGGFNTPAGYGGAGGGGAILIASSTKITVNGSIRANGGNGAGCGSSGNPGCRAGAGSGGAIRLVAPEIAGGGGNSVLQAIGGRFDNNGSSPVSGGPGKIRLEAATFTFSGLTDPTHTFANAPGPVSPGGNPALANVPTLAIASVNLIPVPAAPTGSYSVADITLAPGTTGAIPVQVNATNTPVGAPTEIRVRVLPRGATAPVSVLATGHTGTFASSTATASVSLPTGQIAVLQANAAMTLTGQVASLFPLIDGEPVERVMLAANMGEASTLSLVTKSGKERRVDELPAEDQMRVARAWDAMKATRTE